ncbi:MAG: MarR family transcriptional regulator [Bryobacterales bacterium]|nr:MarR family transcriptional regulator [Bryobacterales bacterium]
MSIQERLQQRKYRNLAEESFVGLLYAGGQVLRRLEEICGRHGITHTQYNVLRILRGAHPEGHPRCEIACRLISRAPDVTRLLDRLEQSGLIERSWSGENRRHSIARITGKGLGLLEAVDPEVEGLEAETTGRLSAAEQKMLARICERLARVEES